MKTRRNFLKKISALSTAAILPLHLTAQKMKKQKMIHQVYFYLHDIKQTDAFLTEAVPLLGQCENVKKFIAGTPADTEKREVVDHSWQVSCTLFFDSLEDQEAYQKDPLHLKFIEQYASFWKNVKVYDIAI